MIKFFTKSEAILNKNAAFAEIKTSAMRKDQDKTREYSFGKVDGLITIDNEAELTADQKEPCELAPGIGTAL